MSDRFADWVGRRTEIDERIDTPPALAAAAMLDDMQTNLGPGSPLPPLWHWFYFLARVPQSLLDRDGHPKRGGFMPPIELPRRMFAGARIRFERSIRIGEIAHRESEIRAVSEKEGRSGKLAFVTVAHRISQGGTLCLQEEQDIVYREPGGAIPAPQPIDIVPPPAEVICRDVTATPTLLFRFSALTFNAHRIHYDRDYAVSEEGYPGLVVHGPLTAVLLMELVRHHWKETVREFSFRGQAPLFDLAPFRLVAKPNATGVTLEAQGPDGNVTLVASAEF